MELFLGDKYLIPFEFNQKRNYLAVAEYCTSSSEKVELQVVGKHRSNIYPNYRIYIFSKLNWIEERLKLNSRYSKLDLNFMINYYQNTMNDGMFEFDIDFFNDDLKHQCVIVTSHDIRWWNDNKIKFRKE